MLFAVVIIMLINWLKITEPDVRCVGLCNVAVASPEYLRTDPLVRLLGLTSNILHERHIMFTVSCND